MLFSIKFNKRGLLTLDGFVLNGNSLRIDASNWILINKQFDKEVIKNALIRVIRKYDLPLPSGSNVDNAALNSVINQLKRKDSESIVHNAPDRVVTRKEYAYPTSDYYLQGSPLGNIVSDYFHRSERLKCGTFKFKSPHDSWHDDKMLAYCLNALWSMKFGAVNDTTLFNCLVLRQYAASQFRVTAAMALYNIFKAKKVLDTSMGWGDRLAGFCFSQYGKYYYGVDPNFRLYDGYKKQTELYGQGRDFDFNIRGSETEWCPSNTFDFAFTSPPYFETERYGSEEDSEQSWVKYGAVDDWLENFLFETIDRTWDALKPGGFMAINIADLGVSYASTDICDPMNDYIDNFSDSYYTGCLGLRLSIRPHTGLDKRVEGKGKSVFVEPVWVWCKGEKVSLDQVIKNFKGGLI